MISAKGIGLLLIAFILLVVLSRLIVRRVRAHLAPRWLGCCYLLMALVPAVELIKMLFVEENGVDTPFFVFWALFFIYCIAMSALELRREFSGDDDASEETG